MRRKPIAQAVLVVTAFAVVCTQCAPAGKRPGKVGKSSAAAAAANRAKQLNKDQQGNCPVQKSDVGTIVAKVANASIGGESVSVDQLPEQTFSLIGVSANYHVDSGKVKYESWQDLRTSPSSSGRGSVDQTPCAQTMIANEIKPPVPPDSGVLFTIDAQFTIKHDVATGKTVVADDMAVDFNQAIQEGRNPTTKLVNSSSNQTLMQVLLTKQASQRGKSTQYLVASDPPVRPEADLVEFQYNKDKGMLQIAISMTEDSYRTRKIFLVYTTGNPPPLPQPAPSPSPAPGKQNQSTVRQQPPGNSNDIPVTAPPSNTNQ